MSSTKTAHSDGEWVTVPRAAIDKLDRAMLMSNEVKAADLAYEAWKMISEAPPAPAAEPVGRLSIEHFRGSRAMENVDFEYTGQLEPGTYQVYTAPPPVAGPVAWTLLGPDGKSSIGGWQDMRSHDWAKNHGQVRDGHRFAYAYEHTAPPPVEATEVTDFNLYTSPVEASQQQPVAPDGWVMVPVSPTSAMIGAGADEVCDALPSEEQADAVWGAMLAAATQPPTAAPAADSDIAELIAAAKYGADDLEAEIKARAIGELPRRIERDMDTVRRLRAALAAVTGEVQG